MSEGGLAVAIAEMAFAGVLGAELELVGSETNGVPTVTQISTPAILFAESNTRFLCEVPESRTTRFESLMKGLPLGRLGRVTEQRHLRLTIEGLAMVDLDTQSLKAAWQAPLRG